MHLNKYLSLVLMDLSAATWWRVYWIKVVRYGPLPPVFYNSFNSWGWLDTPTKENLDKIDVFAGDIRDPNAVRNAMQGMDTVSFIWPHLLAFRSVITPQTAMRTPTSKAH